MNKKTIYFLPVVLFVGTLSLLSACGSGFKLGDVNALKDAEKLAIDCQTYEALAMVDRATPDASQKINIGAAVGDLLRVVILRDSGRIEEADAAMAERNKRWNADAKNIAEAQKSVAESVEKMRDEREKRTGHRTCN
jgi:hypothetical protein